jgi:hypothetical protein
MKKVSHRLSECVSTLCALAVLMGCDGTLSVGADAQGGSGAQIQSHAAGAGGQIQSHAAGAGGQIQSHAAGAGGQIQSHAAGAGGSGADGGDLLGAAGLLPPGAGGWPGVPAGGGMGYGGSYSFIPGVDCVCDSIGDSVCSSSLSGLCSHLAGCALSLSDVTFSEICDGNPIQAQYSAGDRTVISYSLGAADEYKMVYDTASGDLVGASQIGHHGLACNLGGNSVWAVGEQAEHTAPTCNLCSNSGPTCPPAAP